MVHHLGVVAGLDQQMTEQDRTETGPEDAVRGELVLPRDATDRQLAEALVARAEAEGLDLVGPDGLLSVFTKRVLESALSAELTHHLGYEAHERTPVGNARNGTTPKTVQTDIGPVRVDVPRDRDGTFEPAIVPKHSRRLAGFDANVISLYSKGLTTGDIVEHLEQIYGSRVSKDLVSKITDQVVAELTEWQNRPLDPVWPVIFIDAIYVKIRDGQVQNKPIYVAMGVNTAGERDVLGLWVGDGGEGAKHWTAVLGELRNRGIEDVIIVACDGLRGLPDAIEATWPLAQVQTCVVHLVRNTLRLSSRHHWQALTADLRVVYTAPTLDAAEARWLEFAETWTDSYPGIIKMWEDAWEQFIPFLDYPAELRKIMYTTNAIESLNARFRAAIRQRGHFPNDQAALKVLYLCVRRREKNRPNPTGGIRGWKQALNALVLIYGDRLKIN